MYSLIIVFAILSPATGAVVPVGVTSQILAKFKTLDQCKAGCEFAGRWWDNFRSKSFEGNLLVLRLRGAEMISLNQSAE